jgi:hypothetical protein
MRMPSFLMTIDLVRLATPVMAADDSVYRGSNSSLIH